jgi:hypothetical protein
MSDNKRKKSENIVIMPEPSEQSVASESSESDNEVIELTPTEKSTKSKATDPTAAEKKKQGLIKARQVLQERRQKQRDDDEKAKQLIQMAYEKELEAKLVQTTLPKYSRQIKKQILEKLKQRKLQELKKQYGYRSSSDSESEPESDSSESEEEEVVIVKKSNKKLPVVTPKKEVKVVGKPLKQVEPVKPVGILDRMKAYGF